MERPEKNWLNYLLHWCTVAIAAALGALVLTAPWLDSSGDSPDRGQLAIRLFAQDVALRRISLAVAGALIATARIFFRQSTPSE